MAHKQGMPPGSLTTKGIQPTQKAVKATGDDPHGLLKHGPIWTYRPNDPHGLLVNRPNMAHKQGMPPGSLTIEGNLNRGTMSKTVAQAGQPVPALSTELRGVYAGHPNDGHNRNQLRFMIGKTLVSILGLILLVSMIIQGKNILCVKTRRTYRTQLSSVAVPHETHVRGHHTNIWWKRIPVPAHSGEGTTRVAVVYDTPTATLNDKNRTQTRKTQRPHKPQTADRPKTRKPPPTHMTPVKTKQKKRTTPWLPTKGNNNPTNQTRNPGGQCHTPWANNNQAIAHCQQCYGKHTENVKTSKILITYQIHIRNITDQNTNTRSQTLNSKATAALATENVSPQIIMSAKDVKTVSARRHVAKWISALKPTGRRRPIKTIQGNGHNTKLTTWCPPRNRKLRRKRKRRNRKQRRRRPQKNVTRELNTRIC